MNLTITVQNGINLYQVWLDGQLYCYTNNDDDGFRLAIALNKLQLHIEQDNAKLIDAASDLLSALQSEASWLDTMILLHGLAHYNLKEVFTCRLELIRAAIEKALPENKE